MRSTQAQNLFMAPAPATIRTPDQRLRVFVSSTLRELAPERREARAAIERLRLAPVMFELGARPHPPRELYRAYLDQSDIFVGLYWQRYGWVAPGEEISGLEDEYNLAGPLPKLIYIKEAGDSPEPRLAGLLDRVRSDDRASFKYFRDAQELGALLEDDLAVLLAERFDQSKLHGPSPVAPPPAPEPPTVAGALPAPLTRTIGRDEEARAVSELVKRADTRLVTITGPGGIGKTRLAIDVASAVADAFAQRVFVDLSTIREPDLVPTQIAAALGVRDTGDSPLEDKLVTALRDRPALLVLDNFEQVLEAAPMLTRLLSSAPRLTVLVTSRRLLRVSGEHSYEVGPLALPQAGDPVREWVSSSPAVALFVERARAVKPDFELTAANAQAVAGICLAVDGVPLAIELAAARIRILPPAAMLERLDRRLPLLVGGQADRPPRQQTLRATIEWSTDLLTPEEKELLARLGVFAGGFSLELAETVAGAGTDTLTRLGALVDNSLVRQHEKGGRSVFSMLQTVREYAVERLEAQGELRELRRRHADCYLALGAMAEWELEGSHQQDWLESLEDDRDNLRAAMHYLLEMHEWDRAAGYAWTLYLHWWLGGHLGEVREWMEEVLGASEPLADETRGIALYFTRAITFWQDPDGLVIPGLIESAELFQRSGKPSMRALTLISLGLALLASTPPDPAGATEALETSLRLFRENGDRWGEGMALTTIGRVSLLGNDVSAALERFGESLTIARENRDRFGQTIALHHLGWAQLLLGQVASARSSFEESLSMSAQLGHDEGVAYGLEGLVAIAAVESDARRAGTLLGAAQARRDATGLYNSPMFSFHQGFVARMLEGAASAEYEAALEEGRRLPVRDAVDLALVAGAKHPETWVNAAEGEPS